MKELRMRGGEFEETAEVTGIGRSESDMESPS